ncbi:MAG: hypothetical protein DWQ35_02300 [Planctomycetota bacterium]|nr:MAG: hypothetical protein DWQ35_02300 [Planctomycetota bacterium]REK27680.1 MAG: hypothetical protein DWQ42_06870 [Planctomycetota bacterium]REK38477.1 MAG: hypothetical protein DWQ46_20315 [Planctomycetota bacterium]
MSELKLYEERGAVDQPACVHLRSKAMCVTGDMNPTDIDEACDNHCWCNKTQHVFGPDDSLVGRSKCVPGRDCYCETR